MSREWQPGDVAMGRWPERQDGEYVFAERRIVRFDGLSAGWARADDPDDYMLDDHEWSPTDSARPLVVIDVEVREQVERLTFAYADKSRLIDPRDRQRVDAMQAALRSLLEPPTTKPEEPTGLGAVVFASCGCEADRKRFVRDDTGSNEFPDHPWKAGCGDHVWSDLTLRDADNVLSEGVS